MQDGVSEQSIHDI